MVRKTTEQFIEKARAVHGDRYDYSKVVYVASQSNIEIVCKKHGSFWQTPNTHTKGSGCSKCAYALVGRGRKRQKLAGVIEDFKAVHGDRYDYSKVIYVKATTKVEIVCKDHGSFWQTPPNHKSGNGCPKCTHRNNALISALSLDKALENFRKTHGDRYDYSKVVYVNSWTKVEIVCEEHGSFWQRPASHKRGQGCIKCGYKTVSEKNGSSLEQTIKDFKKVHEDRYDYSRVVYVSSTTKVEIICKDHGSFWQTPSDHKRSTGCPKCSTGKSERLFGECLKELGHKASKIRPEWLRNPKTGYPLELDFYIPELKIAFEIQGRQHYEPLDFWGGEEAFQGVRERDQQKRNQCFMVGVTLYEYDLRKGKDRESMMDYLNSIL